MYHKPNHEPNHEQNYEQNHEQNHEPNHEPETGALKDIALCKNAVLNPLPHLDILKELKTLCDLALVPTS